MKQFFIVLLLGCYLSPIALAADQLPVLGLAGVSIRVTDLDKARTFILELRVVKMHLTPSTATAQWQPLILRSTMFSF